MIHKLLLFVLIFAQFVHAKEARFFGRVVEKPHDGDTVFFQTDLHVRNETDGSLSVFFEGATVGNQSFLPLKRKPSFSLPVSIQVRLLNLNNPTNYEGVWAPELDEKGGPESQKSLERMVLNRELYLIVDLQRCFAERGRWKNQPNASRLFHMSRIFGDLYDPHYKTTVGKRQISSGHAFPTKVEQLAEIEKRGNWGWFKSVREPNDPKPVTLEKIKWLEYEDEDIVIPAGD